jgi:hypothetical protein
MSWLYSQALVEEYLGDICLDGEQSAPLNGNPIQQAYCAPDKMTKFSRLSRFGMTFKPLTESRGEELLTLYLEAFHAKTLALQEKDQELMENDQVCGNTWRGSFVKYDPITSLWKTHQSSLLGDLEQFSETWPQWGLMRDGECWEEIPLDSTQKEIEYGFWPTPTKSDGTQHGKEKWIKNSRSKRISLGKTPPTEKITYVYFESNIPMKYFPELSEVLMTWPQGWTHLEPLEMGKFQAWRQQHGEF